ncbi:hypothetical protein OG394_34520 [Kribbella sp. NBC_01245]|uniref:hypothetical protein n=1 Tax=Kribbella sp. NBC_01245 TaxID=2903578 RepID=UPI002E2D9D36|nr:hypothetical protein [Kribbella sp. NBC_01245]
MGIGMGVRRWVVRVVVVVTATSVLAGAGWFALGRAPLLDVPGVSRRLADPAAEAERKVGAAVDVILQRRARAVLTGDQAAFLQDLDPANAALRRRHIQLFRNLRTLGFRAIAYHRAEVWLNDKAASGSSAFRVVMRYQLAGPGHVPTVTELGYTFAPKAGRWLLVDDDDLDADLDEAHRQPWDFGPIQVIRRPGVFVIVSAGDGAFGRKVAADSLVALAEVRKVWLSRLQPTVIVVAMKEREALVRSWQLPGHGIAAFAMPLVDNTVPTDRTTGKVVGGWVVINPKERKDVDTGLLAHEFTHVGAVRLGDGTPLWLVEGLAEYVSYQVVADRSRGWAMGVEKYRDEIRADSLADLKVLPIDGVFHGDFGEDTYGVSWLAVEHLVKAVGIRKVTNFYAEVAKSTEDREQLLRKHTGFTEPQLVAALKASAR